MKPINLEKVIVRDRVLPILQIAAFCAVIIGIVQKPALAQLNENCIVSVLNRTVQVQPDGSWVLPNIPANFGQVKARATCVQNGVTAFGESAFFTIPANGDVNLPTIILGSTNPIPVSLAITPANPSLTTAGQTIQLAVIATYPNGTTRDVTSSILGTNYTTSNAGIASVSANGLVTAVSSGAVVLQASNDGAVGITSVSVVLGGDSCGGIPLSWITANHLGVCTQTLPSEDPDRDGLTNLQEFQIGTDPNNPDTDRDALSDGDEVNIYHTNPLLFSTDGTGIPDGIEAQTGTLGLSLSQKLAKAIQTLAVTPASFVLNVNTIQGLASQQLAIKATLIDGKTVLDLMSTSRGTNYSSSDLNVCNFGAPDGNVFAGNNGTCTITITNSGFTAQAMGRVITFSPTPLSFVSIPGFANSVVVNGNYAYIAAGGSGLQVVDVTNRSNPIIVASLALGGNANDVTLLGNIVFVAAGATGLHAVDVTNPRTPTLRGTLSTGATALDVVVQGTTAYVANTSNLFLADVVNPAAMAQIATLPLAGRIQGVAVDPLRKLAVVTAGGSGLYVVDVSNPKAPVVRGSLSTGDARNVAISGNFAFVADYLNSTTAVDISIPSVPIISSHIQDPNLGGFLLDITLSGNFALGADVKFVNGIPITDISIPTNLQARAILNFPARDDNGMGLAADGSFVYLVTEHSSLNKFGSAGDSRLYIGQYLALQDLKGVPPTVSITSPPSGVTVIQGSTLPIIANATDDVAVAAVNFLSNGQTVFTSTSAPYQFNFTIPSGVSSLTLGATAVDLGGNVGAAQPVTINIIPDPGTTVKGRVIDNNGVPVSGATLTTGSHSGTSLADGTFAIPGVPTVIGNIVVIATASSNGNSLTGQSGSFPPVASGITNVGDIVVTVRASLISLVPADSSSLPVGNCIPFGTNTFYGFTGFIYRNVPAFQLQIGGHFSFDLGALNDVDIRRNIYFAVASANPIGVVAPQNIRALSWTKVASDSQTPLNPRGDTINGNYELTYTAEAPFNFPGGGFIVGFGGSPPGAYADNGCEQVLVQTTPADLNPYFYQRFFNQSDQPLGVLDSGGEGTPGSDGFALGGILIKPNR